MASASPGWMYDNDNDNHNGNDNDNDDIRNAPLVKQREQDGDSSKWILAGGTCLVVAAAWALAAVMGNDLGVQIDWG